MNPFKRQSGFALPLVILIAVILIAAGGAGYYFYKTSGAGKYSSPEKTFSLLIKTAEEGDIDAWRECFTEDSQKILIPASLGEFKTDLKFYKEAGFKVTEKTSDRAVMTSLIPTPGGILVFKKEKGGWKIDSKETITEIKKIKKELIEEKELSEEEKKEEAKKLINEALLKIERAKSEEGLEKLQPLVSQAVGSAVKATELDPENAEIWFQRGNIYFEIEKLGTMGAREWAISCYKKALELEPDNSLYQEKLRETQSQK